MEMIMIRRQYSRSSTTNNLCWFFLYCSELYRSHFCLNVIRNGVVCIQLKVVLYLQLPLTAIHVHHVVVVWYLDLQLPVPITTNVVSSNPAHGEVYWIQLYVIKFGNALRQVGGFLRVLRFSPPIKLTYSI